MSTKYVSLLVEDVLYISPVYFWYFMFSKINAGVFLLIYDKPTKQILSMYICSHMFEINILYILYIILRSRIKNIQIVIQRLKLNIYRMHMGINLNTPVLL